MFDAAIKLNPRDSSLFGARSGALMSLGRVDEAAASLVQGAAVNPKNVRIHSVLSVVRFAQRDYSSAVESARVAVGLDAHNVEAHASLAFGLLAAGRFDEGFREYEWRWRDATFTSKPRDFDRPLWDGSDPAGRTIFVHCEQGFGDNFQFLRYLPMVRALGPRYSVRLWQTFPAPFPISSPIRRASHSGERDSTQRTHLTSVLSGAATPSQIPSARSNSPNSRRSRQCPAFHSSLYNRRRNPSKPMILPRD